MFYITNQSHHRKLNQSDYKKWTNQIPHSKNEQPITAIVITEFSYISPWLIPSSFFPNSYDVLLREMRQALYREEKPVTSYENPPEGSNGVWVDLQLQYLWQGIQPSWHQEEAWSAPRLQPDLRSMRSVFQQTGQPSTPVSPAWETRCQAETTDEETSSTWTRTVTKQQRTVSPPPRSPMENPVGPDVLP